MRYQDEGMVGSRWGSQGAGMLFTTGRSVLLLLRSGAVLEPGTWGIAGGAVPRHQQTGAGADLLESALREVEEEQGAIPDHEIVGQTVFRDGAFQYTTFIARVPEFTVDEYQPELNWESDDWEWFTREEVAKLDLHPGVRWTLEEASKVIFPPAVERLPARLPTVRGGSPAQLSDDPLDFSRDSAWLDVFYGDPAPTRVAELDLYLRTHPERRVRFYHGSGESAPILTQGLLPTSSGRRRSLQSTIGYVYLSVYPGMAKVFAQMGYPGESPQVYEVDLPISRLLPDKDQLANQRAWGGRVLKGTLGESLAFGHSARVKGSISPEEIRLWREPRTKQEAAPVERASTSSSRAPLPEETRHDQARAVEDQLYAQAWNAFTRAVREGDHTTAEALSHLEAQLGRPLDLYPEGVPARGMQFRVAAAWQSEWDGQFFQELVQAQERGSATLEARYDARKRAGLNPVTGETRAQQRAREGAVAEAQRQNLPDEGHYPDLLTDRPNGCTQPDPKFRLTEQVGADEILHTRCNPGRRGATHHLRYMVDGEPVAGLTLAATQRKAATIERVFTDPAYRRRGYARALLDYAKGYFHSVKHSKDLTGVGAKWAERVERMTAPAARHAATEQLPGVRAALTDTLAFHRWFGESKVVGEDGKPLVVYHGSREKFEAFDKSKIREYDYDAPFNGFWFSTDPYTSPAFADAAEVYPVYLSIKNPARWPQVRRAIRDINQSEIATRLRAAGARTEHDAVRMRLQELGFDGVIRHEKPNIDVAQAYQDGRVEWTDQNGHKHALIRETDPKSAAYNGWDLYDIDRYDDAEHITGYESPEEFLSIAGEDLIWVAFEPTQIKSVNNSGAFDPSDPRIERLPTLRQKLPGDYDPPWLFLPEVERWVPAMVQQGVSEVARSPRGFLRAYKNAGGDPNELSDTWRRKRAGFIARHMAQVEARGEPLVDAWGRPTRRHLALIAWAFSPNPSVVRGGPIVERLSAKEPTKETWYHLTDRPRFSLDPKFVPEDNATAIEDRSGRPGIYLGKDVERWVNGYGYWRPFVVEIAVDPSVRNDPGVHGRYGGELFVPAASFSKITVLRSIPLDAYAREVFGEYGWVEDDAGREFDTGAPIPSQSKNRRRFSDYRYTGPDIREMPMAEARRYAGQVRSFAKRRRVERLPTPTTIGRSR